MHEEIDPANWYLFEMQVSAILEYIASCTGQPFNAGLGGLTESNKWHMALREGLRNHLHLNVGMQGIEEPDQPIEENESALFAALIMGYPSIRVILSGEWERAVRAGLITREQLVAHEKAMLLDMTA